ncbi:MAG: hypothetical protein AAF632_26820 [Bacteroidota bacterium]
MSAGITLEDEEDAVIEIIEEMPPFIIRYGLGILLLIVISIFVLTSYIQYPEVVEVQIKVMTQVPPFKFVLPEGYHLQDLSIKNDSDVLEGQSICKITEIYSSEERIITTPITGKFYYLTEFNGNQESLLVYPINTSYIARAAIPERLISDIELGQNVAIELTSYPYREFGHVKGELEAIAPIAVEGFYMVDIHLSSGLSTTLDYKIEIPSELKGKAEITIEERSVLEKLLSGFFRSFEVEV